MMILTDTSIWIDLLSSKPTRIIPAEKLPLLATCPPVIQEVLQGIRDQHAYRKFSEGLSALTIFGNPMPLEIYESAAQIYREGRRHGVTIRSSVDCLIAAVALRHDLVIWHKDRDYDLIAKFRPLRVTKEI